MKARWVLDTLWPELPQVDFAIVARWWPWDYHCVSTMRVWRDESDPIYKSLNKNSASPQQYVTHVYKCDRDGRSDVNHSYYMKEYSDSGLARRGHKEVERREEYPNDDPENIEGKAEDKRINAVP